MVNPVTLPLGRAKLATKPSPMGSDIDTNTIGMLRVSPSRVVTTGLEWATITSGRSSTSSLANFHTSTGSSGAQRYSISRLLPSSHPSLCSPCCNAATLDRACKSFEASSIKTPIRRTRSDAMRLRGHVTAPPPTTVMNSRRRMGEFRVGDKDRSRNSSSVTRRGVP